MENIEIKCTMVRKRDCVFQRRLNKPTKKGLTATDKYFGKENKETSG